MGKDAEVLTAASRAGVYRLPPARSAELLAMAGQCEFAHFYIDLTGVRDKQGFLAVLAKELAFPAWFGYNWDALDDCLADMSWHQGTGFLVIFAHWGDFLTGAPLEFAMALRVFAAAADTWREEGVPFWILFEAASDTLPNLPAFP